jgi:hypothetical protein
LVLWLSVHNTLGVHTLATSTANSDTVDDVSLLSLVSQSACLVWTSRTSASVDDGKLAVLPSTDTQ